MEREFTNGFFIRKDGLTVSIRPGRMITDGKRNLEDSYTERAEEFARWRFENFIQYAKGQPSAIGTNSIVDAERGRELRAVELSQHTNDELDKLYTHIFGSPAYHMSREGYIHHLSRNIELCGECTGSGIMLGFYPCKVCGAFGYERIQTPKISTT